MPLAENKNTVVATNAVLAERVAARLGPRAEVGAWCKKLGADYALVAHSLRRPPSSHGRRRGGAPAAKGRPGHLRRRQQNVARSKHRAGVARQDAGRKVRAGRELKDMRRAGRARAIRAKHRRRLLAAAILPVAMYAAEHTPCAQGELDRLAKMVCSGGRAGRAWSTA